MGSKLQTKMITREKLTPYSKNIAVVTKDGSQYSYKEILSTTDVISENIENRSLVFCLAQNSPGSLAGYLAFVQNKIVPLMLNSDLDSELLNKLIITYKPEYLWVPKKNKNLINSFLDASNEAKKIMLSSDNEWERIFPLTNARDRTTLIHLRDAYRNGIPLSFGNKEIEETKKIFKILAKYGGRNLVGKSNEISPGIFWSKN